LSYFSKELLEPLGAHGITPEFDAAGTFLSGHSVYARPDDLARIGQLLLDDGRWQGRQLLPKDWIAYSTQPGKSGELAESHYGAQLMIDMLGLPGCFGHSGVGSQELIVCPKRGLVLVWFSSAFDFWRQKKGEPQDIERALIEAFPER
jgi:CubicO group peptidase (beta-lactamase class C family)